MTIYRIIYEHNVGQEYGDSKNTMFEVQGTYEVVTRGDNMNFAGYYSSEKYSQDDFHIEFDTRIEAMKYYKYKDRMLMLPLLIDFQLPL